MNRHFPNLLRREFLIASSMAAASASSTSNPLCAYSAPIWDLPAPKKSVAAVVTVYRKNSHADVLIGKILEGWKQDGGDGPGLRLASLYVDQFPSDDLSRTLATKHGFPLASTIREAITLGTNSVAVDGVLSIGEHGDYPWNDKEQHLYPRRRFFEEITTTFSEYGRVVPVFNDKHPGPEWSDAKWMYEKAKELKIPWMAGSSLPVSFREPDVTVPWGSRVEACLGVGYSGLDVYGFHTLEFLQCILERRASAEKGVRWVQCLPTVEIPRLLKDGTIRDDLFDAALATSRTHRNAVLESSIPDGAVFLIQYQDGLLAPVLMLAGHASGISAAFKTSGGKVISARTEERPEPRYPHFAYLLKGIEQMIHTGLPAYPVERTLLTAGVLDRLLTSRKEDYRRLETPELLIPYVPVDYAYAPHIDLTKKW